MGLISVAGIAGIAMATIVGSTIIIVGVYCIFKKKREEAYYRDRCKLIWMQYGSDSRLNMLTQFPYDETTILDTSSTGKQFLSKEDSPPESYATESSLHSDYFSQQDSPKISPTSMKRLLPQIYFLVEYDNTQNLLKVYLQQAGFFESRFQSSGGVSRAFCKVTLLPEGIEKSHMQALSGDFQFEENFSFEVALQHVKEKTIHIAFFIRDQYSRDEYTGSVMQRLNELDLAAKAPLRKKILLHERQEQKQDNKAGEILLRLSYLSSGEKLIVRLLKVRLLKEVGAEGNKLPPDPYVRVAVIHDGQLLKKKKTSTKRKTTNPNYHQAMNFTISPDVLPQVEIHFSVVHDAGLNRLNPTSRKEKKEIIGKTEISPYSTGDEYEHWKDLMSNKSQARWHRLTPVI